MCHVLTPPHPNLHFYCNNNLHVKTKNLKQQQLIINYYNYIIMIQLGQQFYSLARLLSSSISLVCVCVCVYVSDCLSLSVCVRVSVRARVFPIFSFLFTFKFSFFFFLFLLFEIVPFLVLYFTMTRQQLSKYTSPHPSTRPHFLHWISLLPPFPSPLKKWNWIEND